MPVDELKERRQAEERELLAAQRARATAARQPAPAPNIDLHGTGQLIKAESPKSQVVIQQNRDASLAGKAQTKFKVYAPTGRKVKFSDQE